ncbi:MAG: cupin domain-containing protein [Deltaproteobacteria bacterium]|nr:cupin domain-containing protein [Deltaproteobacteria bacterium]
MKIDVSSVPPRTGSRYPKPFDEPCRNKSRRPLGLAAGLTHFGVNLLELAPGAWSSQRHWHSHADEFVYVLRGRVLLVTNSEETILETGDCAAFKARSRDGHHLQNRAAEAALILEVGTAGSTAAITEYPDIDLSATSAGYFHKDGAHY